MTVALKIKRNAKRTSLSFLFGPAFTDNTFGEFTTQKNLRFHAQVRCGVGRIHRCGFCAHPFFSLAPCVYEDYAHYCELARVTRLLFLTLLRPPGTSADCERIGAHPLLEATGQDSRVLTVSPIS